MFVSVAKRSFQIIMKSVRFFHKACESIKYNSVQQLQYKRLRERNKQKLNEEKAPLIPFSEDCYKETSYYYENGLRKVYPYYYTFTASAKLRWIGRKLLDVFASEFPVRPKVDYEHAFRTGHIRVNNEKVDANYRVQISDYIENVSHRHEMPVLAEPIKLVHVDNNYVVVDKPCSIPVHPCGRYRHNSVMFILAKEYNFKVLYSTYRLDRLTSGLLIFGRTSKLSGVIQSQIQKRQVEKEYVCRVEGEFPKNTVECKEPIKQFCYKVNAYKVDFQGKKCHTTFKRLSYNGKTSVVSCKPRTGRTHQIRVHLQYLGFPILNDSLYNHYAFGPEKGKHGYIGKTDEELASDIIFIHKAENWLGFEVNPDLETLNYKKSILNEENFAISKTDPSQESNSNRFEDAEQKHRHFVPVDTTHSESNISDTIQTGYSVPDATCIKSKITVNPYCYMCKVKFKDPKLEDLKMYLHAWKYKGPGWSFKTELPEWAKDDWKHREHN